MYHSSLIYVVCIHVFPVWNRGSIYSCQYHAFLVSYAFLWILDCWHRCALWGINPCWRGIIAFAKTALQTASISWASMLEVYNKHYDGTCCNLLSQQPFYVLSPNVCELWWSWRGIISDESGGVCLVWIWKQDINLFAGCMCRILVSNSTLLNLGSCQCINIQHAAQPAEVIALPVFNSEKH